MHIRQVSIFVENQPGSLLALTRLLQEHHVDMLSITLADTAHFGIVRCIFANPEEAVELIRKAGYTVRANDVLGVHVPDRPGGLSEVLELLAAANVSVEYLYSYTRRVKGQIYIIFRVDQLPQAEATLAQAGIGMISQEDLTAEAEG